jgi:hypothetical protein
MSTEKFYPELASIVKVNSLPEELSFVQDGLQALLSDIFVKEYQFVKNGEGDSLSYTLVIIVFKEIGVGIPGTGFRLLINPGDIASAGVTEIPISLNIQAEILKYVNSFSADAFASNPFAFFKLIVQILDIEETEILQQTIQIFTKNKNINEFVQLINQANNLVGTANEIQIPASLTEAEAIAELVENIISSAETLSSSLFDLIFKLIEDVKSLQKTFSNVEQLFAFRLGTKPIDRIKQLFIPKISGALQLSAALEIPRTVLVPVKPNGDIETDENIKTRFDFDIGEFTFSTEGGIGYNLSLIVNFPPAYPKAQIGNTGLIIGFQNAKLDISRDTNIPEATADGRPNDFIGAYIQEAEIDLPKKWFKNDTSNPNPGTVAIKGQNLIIGTGGISGKIALVTVGSTPFHQKIGNFEISLNTVSVEFHQGSIVNSDIKGKIKINGFKDASSADAILDVGVHIGNDGDFNVTATSTAGILLKIPNVLDFEVHSLSIGRDDDRFFIATSGKITCTFSIPGLTFDRPLAFDMKKLIIWDDGQVEIQGGNIVLPQALTLKIGPVKLSVTAISMGSYERNNRKYKYFGFDGGVNVNPGGVDVKASGVKVYFTTDSGPLDIFVRVEGIAIDLIIPGSKSAADATVLISGFLQMKEPAGGDPNSPALTEYGGGVKFMLPKAGIGGSAAMRLIPSLPAFIVDTELSISVPIPLGNTSLGIYGFRGLIGFRYVADKPSVGLAEDASWYEYYKKKVPLSYKEGITVDKFSQRKGFAIGAGVTLGTLTDSGKAFSAKLFLLLSLPDALLLQGQAAIMSTRVDLSPNDPPFSCLIAITKESVEAAFGVNYLLPEDSGNILNVQALIEMGFFFHDSSAWYINIGRDLPESKRVTARILNLFNAWSYLMISGSGIRAGAGVTWDFTRNFGPVGLEAHAYIDVQGRISFKPKQIGGAIHLGGSVAIKVFKFKLGLSIEASLAAEAPHPFIVTGSADVHLDLPKPFKKFGGDFHVEFTWTFDGAPPFPIPVEVFNETSVAEATKSTSIVTRERFTLNTIPGTTFLGSAIPPAPTAFWSDSFDNHVVPLDCSIDIEFKKPIAPGSGTTNIGITGTGYVNTELVPPQKGKSSQVKHEYVVEEVKIRSWNPATSQWQDYDVYDALTPMTDAPFIDPSDLIGLKDGWWQIDDPKKVNKLSLLSQTPLSYANDIPGSFTPENSGVTDETIYCPEEEIEEICIAIDDFPGLTVLHTEQRITVQNIQFRVTGEDGVITPMLNPFGFTNGLVLNPGSQLEIFFPETTGHVDLRMSTLADDVKVFYMKKIIIGTDSSSLPVYDYQVVKEEVLNAVNLLSEIVYDHMNQPIDKVVVMAGKCKCQDDDGDDDEPCDCCDDDLPAGSSQGTAPGSVSVGVRPTPVIIPGSRVQQPYVEQRSLTETDATTATSAQKVPCGSIAAYLVETCTAAQLLVIELRKEYETLLAKAKENQELCEKYSNEPEIGALYCNQAKELLEEAQALAEEIADLQFFIDQCEQFSRSTGYRQANETAAQFIETKATEVIVVPPRGGGEGTPVRIDLTCKTIIFEMCWLPSSAQVFNSTIPSFQDLLNSNNAMVTAINNTIYPIWRPDTQYAISIKVVDHVKVIDTGATSNTSRYMHMGFRTRGPVGHFHQYRSEYNTLVTADRADEFRLQSLKPYIDYTKSYPNADGNILNAKPLFYVNPKLQVFYIHQFIYTMYGGQFDAYNGNPAVTSTLEVTIHDPVNPSPAGPGDPGYIDPVSLTFLPNNLGHVTPDVAILNNMATQGDPCTDAGQQTGITPMGIQSNVTVDKLKPLKLYLAVFKANYSAATTPDEQIVEVHRYNFQTSRYADFPEMVNSYKLKDRDGVYVKDALFDDIAVTLDTTRASQFTALLANTYPSGDPLEQLYADPFDRLMDGILITGPIDPPVGTDFNIVRDSVSNNVIGILIRNPEPFNDPKVPAPDIAPTITLSQNGGPTSAFKVIYSKDRSKAFVGDSNMNLPLTDLKFTFKYLEYNGSAYITASTVVVNFFVTPPPDNSSL